MERGRKGGRGREKKEKKKEICSYDCGGVASPISAEWVGSLETQGRVSEFLLAQRRLLIILSMPSTNWMKATHIMENSVFFFLSLFT